MLFDFLSLTVAFVVAYFIRENMGQGLRNDVSYRSFYLVFLGVHVLLAFFFRGYSDIVRREFTDELTVVLKQNVVMLCAILIYLVFTKQSQLYSRVFVGLIFAFNFVFMIIIRSVWKKVVRHRLERNQGLSKLLVIADSLYIDSMIERLTSTRYQSFHIEGIVLLDNNQSRSCVKGIPIVATEKTMLEYIRLNVVDQVIVQSDFSVTKMEEMAEQFLNMGIVVHISLGTELERLPNRQIQNLGELAVISSSIQTASMMELLLKRVMDICGSIIGLFITALAFVCIAPIIYIKSPGPIFFSQYRMGRNGRKFKIYKFRSMYQDAEERKKELMEKNQMNGLMFKMDDDPRIIKGIGHFIRNTSIDELPQFFNILKGDMSLVGTRPPTVDEFEQYELHHKVRLSFRPGLTGLWQVSGRSDITDFEEVVRLDEEYIANWNIWLDIKILIKTVGVVFTGKGSK